MPWYMYITNIALAAPFLNGPYVAGGYQVLLKPHVWEIDLFALSGLIIYHFSFAQLYSHSVDIAYNHYGIKWGEHICQL